MGNLLAVDGLYRYYRGQLQSMAMRPFKFAAMVPRNLDWSVDKNEPEGFEAQSGIPVVSANIISRHTRQRAYHPFSMQSLPNGVKVAIVGANYATALTAGTSFANNFTTRNRIGFTGEAIGEAKGMSADIVIVADNSGSLGAKCIDNCLPEFPFMDIQIVNQKSLYGNQTVFSCEDACSFGRSFLRIDINVNPDRSIAKAMSTIVPINLTVPPDPAISLYLKNAVEKYERAVATDIVGRIDFTTKLSMRQSDIENYSQSTGDIVADSIMFMARKMGFNPDVVIINKGTLRDVFPAGNITRDQILSVVPFMDTICVFSISGGYLLQTLQAATKLRIDNAFPQVSGVKFKWSLNIKNGSKYGRITWIEILQGSQWKNISVEESYVVATNGFVRGGGDEYELIPKHGYDFHDGITTVTQAIVEFFSSKVIHESDYEERRGIIDLSANPIRLAGECNNGRFLDQDGSCYICPVAANGSPKLWNYEIRQSEGRLAIASIVLINNGPIMLPWTAVLTETDQFKIIPSSGEIDPQSFVIVNVTREAVSAPISFIHVAITPSDTSRQRECYDSLLLRLPVRLFLIPYESSSILYSLIGASFIFVAFSVLIIGVLVYLNRKSPMIKAASPLLLLINLFGALILSSSSLAFASPVDEEYGDLICELRWWLSGLGFTIMFSPVYMKIYRIDKIFVSRSMRVVSIPDSTLFRGIGLMAMAMTAFLTIHSIEFASVRQVVPAPELTAPSPDVAYTMSRCTIHESNLAMVLTACALLTVWGARIAWHARNVPTDFNESSSIAVSLVFVAIYSSLVLPLQFLLHSSPDALVLLRGLGVNVFVAVSLAALYVGKLDLICRGRASRIPSIGSVRQSSPGRQSVPFSDYEVASP